MRLILYSKPGCHLCEGLQEKLQQIHTLAFDLEIRDITTREEWFQAYQYEIPVLFLDRATADSGSPSLTSSLTSNLASSLTPIPRPSPRASVTQLEQMLRRYLSEVEKNETK
jgi:glutaredoxin